MNPRKHHLQAREYSAGRSLEKNKDFIRHIQILRKELLKQGTAITTQPDTIPELETFMDFKSGPITQTKDKDGYYYLKWEGFRK